MEVSGVAEAGELLDRRAESVVPSEVQFTAPSGPAMHAADTPTPTHSDALTTALEGERNWGRATRRILQHGGSRWVMEREEGEITRLLRLDADNTVVERVPVSIDMAALREVLTAVRNAPDEASARTELARSDAPLAELDPLLSLRAGVPPDQIPLMNALAHHPLREPAIVASTTTTAPEAPACDPNDPLAALPPELVPVANALPFEVQQAIEVMAEWDTCRVSDMLNNPLMVSAFRSDPGNAAVFLRTLGETRGLPLPAAPARRRRHGLRAAHGHRRGGGAAPRPCPGAGQPPSIWQHHGGGTGRSQPSRAKPVGGAAAAARNPGHRPWKHPCRARSPCPAPAGPDARRADRVLAAPGHGARQPAPVAALLPPLQPHHRHLPHRGPTGHPAGVRQTRYGRPGDPHRRAPAGHRPHHRRNPPHHHPHRRRARRSHPGTEPGPAPAGVFRPGPLRRGRVRQGGAGWTRVWG